MYASTTNAVNINKMFQQNDSKILSIVNYIFMPECAVLLDLCLVAVIVIHRYLLVSKCLVLLASAEVFMTRGDRNKSNS